MRVYIYIYPRGGRFTGNSCPVGVYINIYMKLLHGWCYASSGVGWGGDDNVPCTCTHGRCYATSCFLHLHTWLVLLYATSCFLHLHTWLVLRNIMFLALAHMVGATQHHGVGVGWGGDDNVPCTCTHGRCYATSCFLHLHTWLVLRNIMFLALAHMVGATQHHVFCTCTHGRCYATSWGGVGVGWGGDDNVPCTCTHGRCYATSCLSNMMFLYA